MGLLEIKHYLVKVKMASLATLCTCLNASPEAVRDRLNHWVRKGCIRKFSKTAFCGSKCTKCDQSLTEIYEWVS